MKRWLMVPVALLMCIPAASVAGKLKTLSLSGPQAFAGGQRQGLIMTSEGTLRLAPPVKLVAELPATTIWAIAADEKGNTYAATGSDGKLFKIDAAGEVSVLYRSNDKQILCLAMTPGGALFAGTGPSGQILRILPNGEASVWCQTGEGYVWSLAYDAEREEIWAGTGPHGCVLRLGSGGRVQDRKQTHQEHALSVIQSGAGELTVGTSPQGIIYRFTRETAPKPVHQCPQAEVKSLCLTGNCLYAGTSGVETRRTASTLITVGGSESVEKTRQAREDDGDGERRPVSAQTVSRKSGDPLVPAAPSTSGSSAGVRENSVYCMEAGGHINELLRLKGLIHCVAKRGERVVVATGGPVAQLLEINPMTRENTELARLDQGHAQHLVVLPDGDILLAASDPARVYRVGHGHQSRGIFLSEVVDAGRPARWGALSWQCETPPGTAATMEVRSGQIDLPDASWSEWQPISGNRTQALNPAPTSRYLQLRATLSTSVANSSPSLKGVQVRWQQINLAPEVTSIDVPDDERAVSEAGKRLKVKWSAGDPNDDELSYRVSYRKEGWPHWVELARDLEKKELELDPVAMPSGRYQIKVVATDSKDNAEGEAAEAERISSAFLIDHTPPMVSAKVVALEGDRAVVEATASDDLSRLAAAQIAVDGQKWQSVFPVDGLFDGKSKRFRFKTDGLRAGTHVLVFRVADAAGNTGSSDFVFEVRQKP